MVAYIVANIEVIDPTVFERYRADVPAIISRYGGRYLLRANEPELAEGTRFFARLTVIEFPTMDAARAFYDSPEYAPLKQLRIAASKSDLAFIPAYSGSPSVPYTILGRCNNA